MDEPMRLRTPAEVASLQTGGDVAATRQQQQGTPTAVTQQGGSSARGHTFAEVMQSYAIPGAAKLALPVVRVPVAQVVEVAAPVPPENAGKLRAIGSLDV